MFSAKLGKSSDKEKVEAKTPAEIETPVIEEKEEISMPTISGVEAKEKPEIEVEDKDEILDLVARLREKFRSRRSRKRVN